MRREFTINPNGEYEFVVGSSDNFLIMRNLTSDILLESDSFKNVVLSRSDTVDISKYQDMTLRLINQLARPISGEIQLSEVDIRIKEQRMSVDGGLVVDEIATPVTVSEVLAPVKVAGTVPVSFGGGVAVSNFPSIQQVTGSVEVSNFKPERGTRNWTTFTGVGDMYGPFEYVMIQAHPENVGIVRFLGVTIPANGYYELNVPFDSFSEGVEFDVATDKANVVWIRDMSTRSLRKQAGSDAEYIIQGDERIHYLEWEKMRGVE